MSDEKKPGAVWAKMLKLWHGLALVEIPENVIITDVMYPHRTPEDGEPHPIGVVASVVSEETGIPFGESMRLAKLFVETYIAACKELVPPHVYPR